MNHHSIARGGILSLSLLAASAASAQPTPVKDVTVTATRLPSSLSATPGIFVIDRPEIDARQLTFVSQALSTVPGLSVFSNGPFGVTSVRQRGAGADKSLVLVDGVPVNDVSQPQGNFDFAGFDLDNVQRIEVLSGPQASLWGSDAIGGVISVTSRDPGGVRLSLDGGAFGTVHGAAALGVGGERGALGVTGSVIKSKGISAADKANNYAAFGFPNLRNREKDGIDSQSLGLRGRYQVSDAVQLDGSLRYNHSITDIDGYPAAAGYVLADTLDTYRSESLLGQARAIIQSADGWRGVVSASGYDLERGQRGPSGPYNYDARRTILRGTIEKGGIEDPVSFQAGAERIGNRAALSTGARENLDSSAAFVVARVKPAQAVTITASARYDDPERYKGVTTGRVAGVVKIGGGLSLEASAGQGFKTPSISETACDFCFVPPLTLKPEHARGYDGGLSWLSDNGRIFARATAYRLKIRDEISYSALHYVNLARTRSKGLELTLQAELTGGFTVKGGYAYTDAINAVTGARQLRAPKNSGSASLFWQGGKLDGVVTVRAESSQVDSGVNGFSRVNRPGFAVADVAGGYALNDQVKLTARIENLTDKRYQESYGFAAPGRALYVGVKYAR